MIVSLDLEHADGLRLCSQVRSIDRTRHLPILVLAEPGDDARLLRGLDMGVNDYIVRPIDANELLARARTQVKRKRYVDHLRVRLEHSVEMAILDPLTGLHNRRYLASHLATLFEDASQRGKPLSILLIDIDHFKAVNDSHGHDAGRCGAARVRRQDPAQHARHRSCLPARRRGVRRGHAGLRSRQGRITSASAFASASPRLPSTLAAGRARCRSRRASASRRSNLPAIRPSSF